MVSIERRHRMVRVAAGMLVLAVGGCTAEGNGDPEGDWQRAFVPATFAMTSTEGRSTIPLRWFERVEAERAWDLDSAALTIDGDAVSAAAIEPISGDVVGDYRLMAAWVDVELGARAADGELSLEFRSGERRCRARLGSIRVDPAPVARGTSLEPRAVPVGGTDPVGLVEVEVENVGSEPVTVLPDVDNHNQQLLASAGLHSVAVGLVAASAAGDASAPAGEPETVAERRPLRPIERGERVTWGLETEASGPVPDNVVLQPAVFYEEDGEVRMLDLQPQVYGPSFQDEDEAADRARELPANARC